MRFTISSDLWLRLPLLVYQPLQLWTLWAHHLSLFDCSLRPHPDNWGSGLTSRQPIKSLIRDYLVLTAAFLCQHHSFSRNKSTGFTHHWAIDIFKEPKNQPFWLYVFSPWFLSFPPTENCFLSSGDENFHQRKEYWLSWLLNCSWIQLDQSSTTLQNQYTTGFGKHSFLYIHITTDWVLCILIKKVTVLTVTLYFPWILYTPCCAVLSSHTVVYITLQYIRPRLISQLSLHPCFFSMDKVCSGLC